MVITLDGPSGTGKSTLAKGLAKRLNFNFLNSGMIYRAITYYFLLNNVSNKNINKIEQQINGMDVKIMFNNGQQNVIINNINCTEYVSSPAVQKNVSIFSQIGVVRKFILNLQRAFAANNSIVIEGRNVGSEVFPNAEYKFYVECDINIRAQRRYEDLKKLNDPSTFEQVKESLLKRDYLDKTRELSPLRMPEGAHIINTSNKTIDECIGEILSITKLETTK